MRNLGIPLIQVFKKTLESTNSEMDLSLGTNYAKEQLFGHYMPGFQSRNFSIIMSKKISLSTRITQ